MSQGRVARNVATTLLTQLLTWALAFLVTLFLPRYLGADGTGKITISSAFVLTIGVFVPLGTSQVIVKEIARDRSRAGVLLVAGLGLRLGLGLLALPVAYLAARLLGYSPQMLQLILVSVPGMVIFVCNDVFACVYQGFEEMSRMNRATLLDKVLYSVVVLGLVWAKAPLWMIAAAATISGLGVTLLYLTGLGELRALLRLPQWAEIRSLAVTSLPFMGLLVFRTLYGQTDPIVLGAIASETEAGWYGVAFKLVGTALFFPMALVFALLPTLARLHGEGNTSAFAELARRALDLALLIGVPLAAVVFCLPQQLLHTLYGNRFAEAAPVLGVGGLGMLLYFVTVVLGTLVTAMDRQLVLTRSAFVSCLFGIPLCVLGAWLGHRFGSNGALGAIITDIVVELYLVVVYWRALPGGLFDRSSHTRALRYGLAAIPLVLLLRLTLGTSWALVGGAVGALLYGGACVLLRCWGPSELTLLKGMLRRTA